MTRYLAMLTFCLGVASAIAAQSPQPDVPGKKAEKPADKDADKLQKDIDDALKELEKLTPPAPQPAPPRAGAGGGNFRLLLGGLGGRGGANPVPNPNPDGGRFGIGYRPPTPAFANQLKLPAGQGQVIMTVLPNSPADKAGFLPNDVLLELDGKPVPIDRVQFAQNVRDVKCGVEFSAVVLRRGQKETIKGIVFPEVAPQQPDPRGPQAVPRPEPQPVPVPVPQKKKLPEIF